MRVKIKTRGHYDFVDLTDQVVKIVSQGNIKDGAVLIFVPGSTAAITTVEFEKGVLDDIKDVLERMAPEDYDYKHHQKWGDYNGAAHIKSALIGPDLLVPIVKGKLQLGSWQQIVLIDFDERARTREVIIQTIKA